MGLGCWLNVGARGWGLEIGEFLRIARASITYLNRAALIHEYSLIYTNNS
jgi:hypothetical protein